MFRVISLERVTDAVALHGEGPIWHDGLGGLVWVDLLNGELLTLDTPTGEVSRHGVGAIAACVRPRRSGGVIVALENSFALLGPGYRFEREIPVFHDPSVRFNDGTCDGEGNFLCGTMSYQETKGAGTLFRLTPSGTISTLYDGLTISNGIAFFPDGTGVFIDTPEQRIDALEPDGRGFYGRTPFAMVPSAAGAPDGACLDTAGGVWTALWGGGRVHRYDRDGRLDLVIEVPTSQVTACTLGGPDLSTLYVTTSRLGLDSRDGNAGAVFAADVPYTGYPVMEFAG